MALVKKKRGERGEEQQPDFSYFIARREEEIFWKKDKESLGFALKGQVCWVQNRSQAGDGEGQRGIAQNIPQLGLQSAHVSLAG